MPEASGKRRSLSHEVELFGYFPEMHSIKTSFLYNHKKILTNKFKSAERLARFIVSVDFEKNEIYTSV